MPVPNIVKYGDYYLTRHIATGGMAELFRARKLGAAGFEKLFVIKRLLPHLGRNQYFVNMFLDEARLASQLTHQNIVPVYDLGMVPAAESEQGLYGDTYYLCMEYIAGKNLAEVFRACREQRQSIGNENLVNLTVNMAVALAYAHAKHSHDGRPLGIVHRDISPANILLSYQGEVKLVDFGIAKAMDQSSVTQPGVLKGKFAYMSPEQARGEQVDARSDIFSLGAVLWEGLTGRRLFAADSEAAILKLVSECVVPPPSQFADNLSPQLDQICLKCLARDRTERYQRGEDLARDLEGYLQQLSTYPSTYALRNHMHTLFAQKMKEEDEQISEENQALHRMLGEPSPAEDIVEEDVALSQTVAVLRGGRAEDKSPPPDDAQVPEASSPGRRWSPKTLALAGGGLGLALLLLALMLWWPRPASTPSAGETGHPSSSPLAAATPETADATGARQMAADLLDQAKKEMPGAPQRALELLMRAVALQPLWPEAHFQVGRAHTKLNQLPQALTAYRRVVELDPGLASAYFNMGYILLRQEQVPLAISAFQRAVELERDKGNTQLLEEAYTNLGVCFARQGEPERAAEVFRKVLLDNPGNALARQYLSQVRQAGRADKDGAAPGN
jgi:serine/threonine protein kinase/Tfp pilus assembly protein PilF